MLKIQAQAKQQKSHPNYINNEINSNDRYSRRMTIYKRKKLQKMLKKRVSKQSSQLEAFKQLQLLKRVIKIIRKMKIKA